MAVQQTRPPVLADIYGSTGDLLGAVVGGFHATGFPQASPPFRRGFNATLNHIDKVATYLLQGMSELTIGESYAINRVMLSTINYQLYRSKLNQTYAANDELDPAKWELYLGTNAVHKHADYNATTNTPDIADINNNGLYIVTTAGFVSGVSIQGALTTGGSYLMADDIVFNNNGNLELFRSEIIGSQSLNFGTGTFTTLKSVNDYINQRLYTELTLNQTANTAETASTDVTNDCGGALTIKCNGFTIAMSAGFNCEISGSNVLIDNFKLTGNFDGYLLKVHDVMHQNDVSVTNAHTTTTKGGIMYTKSFLGVTDNDGQTSSSITVSVQSVGKVAIIGRNSILSCLNMTANGMVSVGEGTTNYIFGNLTTGGGEFFGNRSATYYIGGSVNTGGGLFNGGSSANYRIEGSVTTGGGLFDGGNSANYFINGSVTTGGGLFNGGSECSARIFGSVNGAVGATFSSDRSTLTIVGDVTGYTVAGIQRGNAFYVGATSAGVLRNQNTNTLMAN